MPGQEAGWDFPALVDRVLNAGKPDAAPWVYEAPSADTLGTAQAPPTNFGADADVNLARPATGETEARRLIREGEERLKSGPGQGYIQSMQGLMAQGGDANQAQQAFAEAQNLAPADMGAYYDRAGQQAIQGIDKQAASRGAYGSSAALELGQSTLSDLAADRSLQEAQYGINRADMMGRLGQGAATSQQAAFGTVAGNEQQRRGLEFSVLQGLADMGIAVDQSRLSRIMALFGSSMGMSGAKSNVIGAADAAKFGEAGYVTEQQIGAGLGGSAAGASLEQMQTGDERAKYEAIAELGTGGEGVATTWGNFDIL